MNEILTGFEIIFLVSLVFTSLASIVVWFYNRKLVKSIKKLFEENYPKEISIQNYKEINNIISQVLAKFEENEDYSNELNKLLIKYSFNVQFINKIKEILSNYKSKILPWKKYGRYTAYLALISGAISFILYYLVR